jgi:hypothetical protein
VDIVRKIMKMSRQIAVGIGLLAMQVPFMLTRHIQEDAYITFRCSMNLVATGVYGYNAGDRVSASTSHLSVLIVALVRLAAGAYFIPATQVLYGVATLVGLYLMTTAVVRESRNQLSAWVAISLLPVSLMIAYGGMETALVVLLTGAVLRSTWEPRPNVWTGAAFVLLPWARPDAVVLGIITIVAAIAVGHRSMRAAGVYAAMLASGGASWLLFNRLYFGVVLPQSVHGKAAVWMPSTMHDAAFGGAARLSELFFGDAAAAGIFAPIATKYLSVFSIPACLIVAAAAVAVAARPARFDAARPAAVALAGVAFVMPLAYAFGGAMAPWYFWPSAVAGWLLVIVGCAAVMARQRGIWQRLARAAGAGAIAALLAGQWLYAASWGTQEHLYRGGIGDEIRRSASAGDTLLLEPAGYVPFHAQLWTWDEIGVTSPLVTSYRLKFGPHWWIRFVEDLGPTFLLERDHILAHRTLDGYELSLDEQASLAGRYSLVRVFRYEPDRLRPPGLMRFAARLGSARDYYLYRRIDPPLR